MRQAAVYARVSTWEQALKGFSLKYQLDTLPELARSQGYLVENEDIYSEVISGANDERPEYNRMIAAVIEGKYQAIFAVEKSRLSRTDSRIEEERVVKSLQRCGCIIITPYTSYDPSTAEGEFLWDILSAVDRNERKRILARNARGRLAKAKLGGFLGGDAPTGYDKHRDKRTGKVTFKLNNNKIAPVRMSFDLIQKGLNYAEISRALTQNGYATIQGNPYSHQTIKGWVTNPHFAGYTHIGYSNYSRTKTRYLSENNTFLEPIVSKAVFQTVKGIVEAREKEYLDSRHQAHSHPLCRILRCPNCNQKMSADFNTRHYGRRAYYRCKSRNGQSFCFGELPKTVPYNKIHFLVLDLMHQLIAYGYKINIKLVQEFKEHLLYEAGTSLSKERIPPFKALFKEVFSSISYRREGRSYHSYTYNVTGFTTTLNERFIMNQFNEIQKLKPE